MMESSKSMVATAVMLYDQANALGGLQREARETTSTIRHRTKLLAAAAVYHQVPSGSVRRFLTYYFEVLYSGTN